MDAATLLPNELWLDIFDYLLKPDLKNLRLTGEPHLRHLASSLLFTTTYAASRKGVLDVFTKLTSHPVFRHTITEVVFDSSWFSLQPHNEVLFNDQERIQADELEHRLEDAFQLLSNVKTVRYADLSRISCLPGDQSPDPASSGYTNDPLMRRLESIDCVVSDIGFCLQSKHVFKNLEHLDFLRRQSCGLVFLMQALSTHPPGALTHLSLGDRLHAAEDGGIPHWFFSSITCVNILNSCTSVFRNLRRLDLGISFISSDRARSTGRWSTFTWFARTERMGADLAQLISLAKGLQELKLSGGKGTAYLCFADVFAAHTWTKLRRIDLKYFEATANELLGFVSRHGDSLHRMTLDSFNLETGLWRDVGSRIPLVAPRMDFIVGCLFVKSKVVSDKTYKTIPQMCTHGLGIYVPEDIQCRECDAESEDEDEIDHETTIDDLEYSSDDSFSPGTAEEPRRMRGSDLALLDTMLPEHRTNVERLRQAFPKAPIEECQKALILNNDDHLKSCAYLKDYLSQPDHDFMDDPELAAQVLRLKEALPFDCPLEQCQRALDLMNMDHEAARRHLREYFYESEDGIPLTDVSDSSLEEV